MRAFGDGTRLRIIGALSVQPTTVGDLTRLLRSPVQRISRHLLYLHARGIVESEPHGKGVAYRLAAPQSALHATILQALQASLEELEEIGEDRRRQAKAR